MKIKYEACKGDRVLKGSLKVEAGYRCRNFSGLIATDNNKNTLWWCETSKKWKHYEDIDFSIEKSASTHLVDLNSFKSVVSHIRNHNELSGSIVTFVSSFPGYDITFEC